MEPTKSHTLDQILVKGVGALDLPAAKYESAVQKYRGVGKWLCEPDTLLAKYDPQVYAQGSIAIGTATKPVGREEFDIDLVCVLKAGEDISPAELKEAIGDRLRESKAYGKLLVEKNRCWRLEYVGDFHMDILPAIPDTGSNGDTALLIPDKEMARWKRTDPKGYAAWFAGRSELSAPIDMEPRAEVEAPPPVPNPRKKTPLQLAVQYFKRHRDLWADGDEDAPISIIITTLAALAYEEQDSILGTLRHLLESMPGFISKDSSGAPFVGNPVNPDENFADKWKESPRKAEMFHAWVNAALQLLEHVADAELPHMADALTPLIGEGEAIDVVSQHGEAMDAARTSGLTASAATGMLGSTSAQAHRVPKQTFYGGDAQ